MYDWTACTSGMGKVSLCRSARYASSSLLSAELEEEKSANGNASDMLYPFLSVFLALSINDLKHVSR
jgi:hypothetical protein